MLNSKYNAIKKINKIIIIKNYYFFIIKVTNIIK